MKNFLYPYGMQARLLLLFLFLFAFQNVFAQYDDCATPQTIAIGNSGFATGVFGSTPVSITSATVQTGETFAPAILVAGQSQKSVWFKFTLPTTRNVKVTLTQGGTAITAGDAGFAVYKNATCLPTNAMISNKLTPLPVFGNTTHPCTEPGEYLVQVSAKAGVSGSVVVQVETALPAAAYDSPAQAYNFGTLAVGTRAVTYDVDCQSIDDAAEICGAFSTAGRFNKSTWHVFKTPAYFDVLAVFLAQLNGTGTPKFGYKLYQGDVRSASYTTLPITDGCDSLQSTGSLAVKQVYTCSDLLPNTTYSIQLFFHETFNDNVKLCLSVSGAGPTQAPEPILSNIPAPTNAIANLPMSAAGINTNKSDNLACNSRHQLHPCLPSLPANGATINTGGYRYNLSSFFTFTLATAATLNISTSISTSCGQPVWLRLYYQGVSNNCTSLDPATIVAQSTSFLSNLACLQPGQYTLQVLGIDSAFSTSWTYGSFGNSSSPICVRHHLGARVDVTFNARTMQALNNYALNAPGAFDTINKVGAVMQNLVNNTTYTSQRDTFGCSNTVLPSDTTCAPLNKKAIYREFTVADSTLLTYTSTNFLWYKLYRGDADALAQAQGVNSFPGRITGLTPFSLCNFSTSCDNSRVCVVPGTYTHATFGADGDIGKVAQATFKVAPVVTTHYSLATAEDMGDILAQVPVAGGSMASSVDYFSCKDNTAPVNGYTPCTIGGLPAKKAIYRQFYLSAPAIVSINNLSASVCGGTTYKGPMTLFSGKATAGEAGLTPMPSPWRCFTSASTGGQCTSLPAGWYTLVSYATGSSYANPMQGQSNNYAGESERITISITKGCAAPKYNRPYRAAVDVVTNQPFLIQWAPRVGHTAAYPKTDTLYTLPTENFNCTIDTPFALHPIPACNTTLTKVAYYVFQTTQEAYVKIDAKNYWAAVYAGNARTDSASFASAAPIQPCQQSAGFINLCRLQPGTYTLVVFATTAQNCNSVQPTIYIDGVGHSRFDFAAQAYDFGILPPDSTYYSGKVGDVNPLNSNRAPSNDFIYCTTGASANNPTDPVCTTVLNSNIYPSRSNAILFPSNTGHTPPRRNLWYTFVAETGGYVRVRVANKTPGKTVYQPQFAVYRSNVNGALPFATVVASGEVDSTIAQGLSLVVRNPPSWYCYNGAAEVNFYRDPCNVTKERYYILVENPSTASVDNSGLQPNAQFEVSILVDSINAVQPKFDHYFQASAIGTNLSTGTYTGATDNYSCATTNATDPTTNTGYGSCATRTLWYKFTTNITGNVRYRVMINGTSQYQNSNIQLFRQIIPNDSTFAGLQFQNPSNSSISDGGFLWGQSCISPGTYYLILTGCSRLNENAYPVIKIVEQAGDFCSAPMVAPLNGAGSSVSTVTVDCHTIGTDYGEFNPNLTCPNGVPRGQYKSSWFRVDITGTDTLDVTTFLTENTNALPADIKYRMMKGNCGAMQEQSCVQDALTKDTYKCLGPGSYFVQVFTPVNKSGSPVTGTISLNLTAVKHADTCAPVNNCLSSAAFIPQYDCTTADHVTFSNFSTYGSAIQYQWDFGYGGQTSNAVSPTFKYPELSTSQTYTVTLTATNTGCTGTGSNSNTVTQTVTIPARPNTSLPNDTTLCTKGASLLLNATSWPGSTYQWQNGSTAPTFTATTSGTNTYWVRVTYNGCVKRDTVVVNSNPNTRLLQTKYLCGSDSVLLTSIRNNGETYLWNSGQNTPSIYASADGQYINNVDWKGCVVKDTFNVLKAAEPWAAEDTTICFPFKSFTLNATTPGAISYSWQNGATGATHNVTTPGVYWVNTWNGTCTKKDSVVVKTTAAAKDSSATVNICSGLGYTLPWGVTVTAPGTYRDTIRYTSGCDSLRQTVNLSFMAAATITTSATVCNGASYTLPWGTVVTASGIYRDTLRTASGCDSLVRSVNLTVKNLTVTISNASICAGQTYTLPWGATVNATGIYRDTVRYSTGCDSLIRTVNLLVRSILTQSFTALVCSGQPYTLPWGTVVSAAGTYGDTLRYTSGCDSLIRTVTLSISAPLSLSNTVTICAGQGYTLPWGSVVTSAGIYRDTIRYTTGCDSLVRSVILSVNAAASQTTAVTVCSGQPYTLPWGAVVTSSGVYRDTLRYSSGCDSVRREVTVTVKDLLRQNSNAAICASQSFTLPWGTVVNATGVYADTLRYASGCDSLIRSVTLRVDAPLVQASNAVVCNGQIYTLPWGAVVSTSGIYHDTTKYVSGCDSLIRSVAVTVQRSTGTTSDVTICAGQNYVLPWGQTVSASGVYRDTLHYASGCDSLMRQVNLTVKSLLTRNTNATICSGSAYTLPWGTTVSVTGIYGDTLRYTSGCDSLIQTVDLRVTAPAVLSASPVICSDETYTLPWGTVVTASGIYRDTLRTASGCDSLVRSVNLTVKQQPVVQLSKSNDINCMLGVTKLSASGGSHYLWSPSVGLSNPAIPNPVASPAASTVYKVAVTGSNGCTKEDSIAVTVAIGNPANGYLVASAFTPNNDGKNDCFGISTWGDVKDLEFSVFNRWGHMVFYTANRNMCWDGTVSGVLQKTDVYVYVIKAKTVCGPVLRKGTVTLIR